MRVLHIISCLVKTDGHSLFCMQLAEHLSERGLVNAIFTLPSKNASLSDPKGLIHYADSQQFHIFNIAVSLGLERQITALIMHFKPDVIHLHGGWHPVLFLGACVAQRMCIPLLLSLHGSLRPVIVEGDKRLRKRLAWWLYQRRLIEKVDTVHVSTEVEKDDLIRLGFNKPVFIVPNGVDMEENDNQGIKLYSQLKFACNDIQTALCDESDTQHKVGQKKTVEPRKVLYLGRLHPLKGLDLLIEAWAKMKNQEKTRLKIYDNTVIQTERAYSNTPLMINGIQWQLIIAGPDEQGTLGKIKSQAKRVGLTISCHPLNKKQENASQTVPSVEKKRQVTSPRFPSKDIIFIGPVFDDNKAQLLASATLFVLPTRTENFGIAVAEALARGIPVITTKGAPWPELLGYTVDLTKERDGLVQNQEAQDDLTEQSSHFLTRCGWWVDIGVDPLMVALREAMSLTDGERQVMGQNGKHLIKRKYCWKTVTQQMMHVYQKTTSKNK